MPSLPFKSKASSSKTQRPPPPAAAAAATGGVAPEQYVSSLTARENWPAAPPPQQQQAYRAPDVASPGYPQIIAGAGPAVRQSLEQQQLSGGVNAPPAVAPNRQQQLQTPAPATRTPQDFRQSYHQDFGGAQHSQQQQQTQTQPPPSQEGKRGLRERLFGHSSSSRDSVDQTSGASKPPNRTASIRRKTSPHKPRESPTEESSSSTRKNSAYWSSRHSSTANLPVSHEADEGSHNQRYDPRPQLISPPVPAKDFPLQAPQHYHPQHQYQTYSSPSLPRVSTDQSGSLHSAQDSHSPQEYAVSSIQPTPELKGGAFQQQPLPNPLLQQQPVFQTAPLPPPPPPPPPPPHAQSQALHGNDPAARYQYYQQHQQPQDQPPIQQIVRTSTLGPPPPAVPQHQQEIRLPITPSGQPPPYKALEIHTPQPVRGTLQVQQLPDPTSNLYPPRPPSQHAPPSPLNPTSQQPPEPPHSPSQPPSSSSDTSAHLPTSTQLQTQAAPHAQAPRKEGDMPAQGNHSSNRDSSYQSNTQNMPVGNKFHRPPREDSEVGRNTPPPRAGELSEDEVAQYNQLVKEHKELRDKYQKVKKYYFEKEAQVHTLQNTLAHQRLSQSRTSLDDSEYAGRFTRLDGLISQLAFSIRKDWKSLPQWLHPGVNKDAITVGKQEMTVCGRALISQWIVEELFDTYFHPDLEPGLSMQLKQIQTNVRRFAPISQNSEEEESLQSKVITWRLATLEGLQDELRSPQAHANRQHLVETLNERLIGNLSMHLQEPAPPDLAGGVPMIVELSVGILAHLPMESRDVVVEYSPPGSAINSELMKIESSTIAPLQNPMAEFPDNSQADRISLRSTASDLKDMGSPDDAGPGPGAAPGPGPTAPGGAKDDARKSRNMLGGLMGTRKPNAPPGPPPGPPPHGKIPGASGSQVSLTQQQPQQPPGSSSGVKEERPEPKVRVAAGVSVHVRGRNVLWKSPVYSTG